jgi:hypothetical protein
MTQEKTVIQPLLKERIQPAIRRLQMRRAFLAIASVMIVGALVVIGLLIYSQTQEEALGNLWPILSGGILLATCVAGFWGWTTGANLDRAVAKIESTYPDLDSALVTACEQVPEPGQRTLSFLQQDVVRQAIYHSYDKNWADVVRASQLATAPLLAVAAFLTVAAALVALIWYRPTVDPNTVAFDEVKILAPTEFELTVEPGNAEVEKGTSLLVFARFGESIPSEATILCETVDGEQTLIPMNKSLDDPVFGARIPDIDAEMSYQVVYAKNESDSFEIGVFEHPDLVRSDAEIDFPEYTQLDNKEIQDVRRVSAVEGSKAELQFHLNKAVEQAVLVTDFGKTIELRQSAELPNTYTAEIPFDEPGRQSFRLKLTDSDKRVNKDPPRFVINTLENKKPDLKLLSPSNDMQVSALEEINVQAKGFDDYGIKQFGLSYTLGDNEEKEVIFEPGEGKKQTVDHLLALEQLQAAADEFLTYYVWAEDFGPNGEVRRVSSDVFFAEVRPFEEIYRQAEAAAGGQQQQQQQQQQQGQNGQNAQQAQELAELQKQIITATWNLIRRETGPEPTDEFVADTEVLAESQEQAMAQLEELASQLEDASSAGFADEASSFMSSAVGDFQKGQVNALDSAFKNAKSAYQGLLKLRSREHQVQRQEQQQQQQQQQSQANQQRQQQLNQLNMEQDENPYQQEQLAQEQNEEEQQQQENRQILSRLRELARRQNDLNKRIKELQSALEEAESEEEKDEIERDLERLREEQQKILRDAEEIQERMDQSENQEAMEEPSQQMEEARDNARRASEALEQGEVSQAAAEGQRTEEQLEELRDEFQNRTAGQYNEQMREMRNEAQDIEQKQNELQDRLADLEDSDTRSTALRESDSKEEIAEDLAEQRERIADLREEIKETVEEAEEFEPLLAEQLYDTYRDSEQQRLEDTLESTERSIRRGLMEDARREEDLANQGVQNLREGIEKAAESVLGDETQALESARKTVEQLRRELENEINENDPEAGDYAAGDADAPEGRGQNGERQESSDEPESTERESQQGNGRPNSEREPREGEPQQGEGEPQQGEGEPQQGEGQPQQGEGQPQQGEGQPRDGQGRQNQERPQQPGLRSGQQNQRAGQPPLANLGPETNPNFNDREGAPLTGEDFLDWADRLRDVEEMVNDPELRAEASRIRDKAKEVRKDFKRHSKDPNWDLVEMEIAKPLQELQKKLTEELIRRSNKNSVVPLDRDPVPRGFQNAVDNYYRELGTGK